MSSPSRLFSPSLPPAATRQQEQHSFVTATDGVSLCMRAFLCMLERSVCCRRPGTQNDKKSFGVYFQKQLLSLCSLRYQYEYSTAAAVQCSKVSRVLHQSRYMCVVGAQQQEEIKSRQHFHVQCNNQTYIVGPHMIPGTRRLT